MATPSTTDPAPPYRLACRRWVGVAWAFFGAVLAPLVFVADLPGPLAVAVALVLPVMAGVYLVRPPPIVRLDDRGLVFDRRRVGWDELSGLDVRDTFFGLRLRACAPRRRWPSLFQPFVPVPLRQVADEIMARAHPDDVALALLPQTRLAAVRRPALAVIGALALAAVFFQVPVPGATTEGPRTVEPVAARLRGAEARPGEVLILAVRDDSTPSAFDLVRAGLDDAVDVNWVLPWDNRHDRQQERVGDAHRRLSESSALAAALGCVGRPVDVEGGGVVVTDFRPSSADAGVLEPGDRVVAADGRALGTLEDLYAAAAARRPGDVLLVEARGVDGGSRTAGVPIAIHEGAPVPRGLGLEPLPISVSPDARAPRVELGGLEGGSAGLASALGLVDALGPGPLVAGRRIAATGTIAPDGRVGPVAGLRFKAAAARQAHASLLVVPASQADVAIRYAGAVPVVGVASLDEAVRAVGGAGCSSGP